MATKKAAKKTASVKKTTKIVKKNLPKSPIELIQSRLSNLAKIKALKTIKNRVRINRKFGIIGGVIILVLIVVLVAFNKLSIAWVDGRPVSWFQYYSTLDSKYGKDLKEQLISQQLVIDEADKRHISVSSQEIDTEINNIMTQAKGQDNFNALLAQQGLTLDELKQQIKLQLMIKKMFQPQVKVTDDEVNKYISDNQAQYPNASDSAKADVRSQLEQQKLIDIFRSWLDQAQKSNRVIRT